MIKKVFVGVLLAAAFGFLVFGAVNRTMAKALDNEPLALNESAELGYGGDNGNGNSQNHQNRVLDGGVDDCIADGEYLGAGPGSGYATGNDEPPLDGTGYGYGNGYKGSEDGLGGQPDDAPADGTGIGLADVDEWVTDNVTVASVDTYLWVVTFEDGTSYDIDGRTLSFLQELGFSVNPGDSLVLTGFYDEDGIYEIGQVENLTTGETAVIRTDSGTPLWSGGQNGGQGGSQTGGQGGRRH